MSSKSRIVIGLLVATWLIAAVTIYSHKNTVALVRIPPQSLAKWYKPENKRHVWLHTMFNLRREAQAIRTYAAAEDSKAVAEWVAKFSEHYNKIGEMVPEWESLLDKKLLRQLQDHQALEKYSEIPDVLTNMEESCNNCHDRYRVVTALLYRAPDFSHSQVETTKTYAESMVALNQSVNDIRLAFVRGAPVEALESLVTLKSGIDALGSTCVQCHKHTPKNYPDKLITEAIVDLETQLRTSDMKKQGQALGTLAVLACAQCHGTHRIVADTRQLLIKPTSIGDLLAH